MQDGILREEKCRRMVNKNKQRRKKKQSVKKKRQKRKKHSDCMSQLIISFSSSSCSNSFGWVIVCLPSYAFHLRDKRKDLKQQTHTFINHSLLYQIFLCLAISIFRIGFEYRDLIMYFVIRNSNKFYLNVIIVNVENFWANSRST